MLETMLATKKRKNKIDLFGVMPKSLSLFASAIGGGYLHIFGGQTGNGGYNNVYYYMDLATKQWYTGAAAGYSYYFGTGFYIDNPQAGARFNSEGGWNVGQGINGAAWWFRANTNQAANGYTSDEGKYYTTRTEKKAVVPEASTDIVYFLAGYDGTNTLPGMVSYRFSSNRWTVHAPIPRSLNGHTVGHYKGKIYCAGGYSTASPAGDTKVVYEYDPATNVWTNIGEAPGNTSWAGGCVYKNLLVLPMLTNVGNGSFYNIAIFDLDTRTWRTKNTGLVARIGSEYVPDPIVNKGVFVLGGISGNYVGGPSYESNPRFNSMYLLNEDWLYN